MLLQPKGPEMPLLCPVFVHENLESSHYFDNALSQLHHSHTFPGAATPSLTELNPST